MFKDDWERQLKFTPTGSQTLSKMPSRYVEGVYPKLLVAGEGSKVWDNEGREYIDLISGLGAVSVGYSNNLVNEAVKFQILNGVSFSLPNTLEADVAEKLCQLVPFTEQWKFCKTGTEACMAAVRAARAYTKRDKVMSCGYHGWSDIFECAGVRTAGIPESNKEFITKATYNDINSFHKILDGEYACVIMEPMVFEDPKPKFLETIKEWCEISNTLLIFDEVVTGGRTSGFTMASLFKIEPDIIILGKALANGFPLAAVGGKRGLMQTFGRDDFFVSGTFGGECVSLAACYETLHILERSIKNMLVNGLMIKQRFNSLFFNVGAVCKGYPTRLTFDFPTQEHKALFMQEMCLAGVLVGYSNMVSADYKDEDIEEVNRALQFVAYKMKQTWEKPKDYLQGNMPIEALRMR